MKPEHQWGAWLWLAMGLLLAVPAAMSGWVDMAAPATWPPPYANWVLHPNQGWRQTAASWWGTAWLHGSPAHFARNLAGVALVIAMGWAARVPWQSALAWFLAWPLTHLGMLLRPELGFYLGLSGVLHAGAAVAAMALLSPYDSAPSPASRALGWLLILGLAIKIIMENPWQHVLILSSASAIKVTPWAHLSGAIAGLVMASLVRAGIRPRPPLIEHHQSGTRELRKNTTI